MPVNEVGSPKCREGTIASTMLRALVWKEWREQRSVVVGGSVLAAATPLFVGATGLLQPDTIDEIVGVFPVAFLGFVWPLIAAATGALTIANEQESGTLPFLLSRPVSCRRLWLVKVAVALLAAGSVAAVSLVVVWISMTLAMFLATGFPLTFPSMVGATWATNLPPMALASLSALLFACAVLSSTLLIRPLTAAAAGLALALTLLAAILLAWGWLSLVPRLEPQWFAAEVLVVTLAVLLVSLVVFARGELFDRQKQGSTLAGYAMVASVGLLVSLACVLPLVYANVAFDADSLAINFRSMTFNGSQVAMAVTQRGGDTSQIWLLESDASGMRPVSGRHTYAPRFFPGRPVLVYLSQRRFFGTPSDRADLRVVDTSIGEDRLVLVNVPPGKPLFFSGAAEGGVSADDRVTFLDGDRLTIARLDGHGAEVHDIAGTLLEGSVLLGYNDASPPELLFVEAPVGEPTTRRFATTLRAYAIASGETRTLATFPSGWVIPTLLQNGRRNPALKAPVSGWSWIPMIADGRLYLVDAVIGDVETLDLADVSSPTEGTAFRACRAMELVTHGGWLAPEGDGYSEHQVLFGDCSEDARSRAIAIVKGAELPTDVGAPAGLVRLRGLESGDERVWTLPGFEGRFNRAWLSEMWLSRDQNQVMVYVTRGYSPDGNVVYPRAPFTMLLTHGGDPVVYPSGWAPIGWLPGGRVLFWQRRGSDGGAFATADAMKDPADLRELYSIRGTEQ